MRRMLVVVVFLFTAAASAAPSARYADWPNGPVKWLMTRDDQRAWKAVAGDRAAQEFIDLFWARRDPSVGTPDNEFRTAFEQLVIAADRTYTSDRTRGSLTEPGRIIVLLGPPRFWTSGASGQVPYSQPPNGQRASTDPVESPKPQIYLSSELIFDYECLSCLHLTKPVKLRQNDVTREYMIDTQLSNAVGALDYAAKHAIVSPDLNQVPDWAKNATKQLQVTAVTGIQRGRDTDSSVYTAGVLNALKQLRPTMPYKRYRLEDSTILQSKGGGSAESQTGAAGRPYRVSVSSVQAADGAIRLSGFAVAPYAGEPLLKTDVTLAPGETVPAGTTKLPNGDTLIFFVTALP